MRPSIRLLLPALVLVAGVAVANGVLGNYQGAGATILRTDSVPATATAPAQHYIAAAFVRPDFAEAAFARFLIADGIHGHRIHGPDAAARMNTWLGENGRAVEDRLMALSRVPTRQELD